MTMPTVLRDVTHGSVRLVVAADLPDALVVARRRGDGHTLVVVPATMPQSDVRGLTRLLLPQRERVDLLCALRART
jgi:hypothetical protein